MDLIKYFGTVQLSCLKRQRIFLINARLEIVRIPIKLNVYGSSAEVLHKKEWKCYENNNNEKKNLTII